MITPSKLFYHRLIINWKYQYNLWKTVIDWIVVIYLIVPAILLGGYEYLEWWNEAPIWLNKLPLNIMISLNFMFVFLGSNRLFIEEADQLFLLQFGKWINKIKLFSICYSFLINTIITLLFYLILAPFFILHYKVSLMKLIIVFCFSSIAKNSLNLSKHLIALKAKGFYKKIVIGILYFVTSFYYVMSVTLLLNNNKLFLLSLITLVLVLWWLIRYRLSVKGTFFKDIATEQERKIRLGNLFLSQTGINFKLPKSEKKQSWVFANSNSIFMDRNPVNILVEACVKSVLRNKRYVELYIQINFIALIALLSIPQQQLKILLWIILSLIIGYQVGSYWHLTINAPFLKLFKWKTNYKMRASNIAIFIMVLPGYLCITLFLGIFSFSWLITLVFLVLATILGFISSYIITRIYYWKGIS